MKLFFLVPVTLTLTAFASAHDGHSQAPSPEAQERIERLNTDSSVRLVVQNATSTGKPSLANYFAPFSETVNVRFDKDFLYVECDGMPEHPMMIGITAWQQQVPLPQPYTGDNAWRIPLHPVPARNPMSAKDHFFRGAIALAVNGVPIFNPIKNDGKTDTLLAGELDQWGGHCGRGDDYHYHIAPVHLEKIVGKGNPVGVALDGYPIYGYEDPDGTTPKLDWLNGHQDVEGNYHYHATKNYPYLNGGFYGEVVERGGQVDPQPRAQGVRPAAPPLRGAKITGFEHTSANSYAVIYDVFGERRSVEYTVRDDGSATFNFVSPQGTKTENYTPRQRAGGSGDGPRGSDARTQAERNAAPPQGRGGGPPQRPGGPPPPQRSGNGPPRGGSGDPLARAIDTNHDGKLDRVEIDKAGSLLRSLDSNHDGTLSQEELRGGGQSGGPRGQGGGPRSGPVGGRGNEGIVPASPPVTNHPNKSGNFKLTSPVLVEGAPLPDEFNGNGEGATPPLQWNGAPAGTKSFAIIFDHIDRDHLLKTYWNLYGIPASVTSLPKNVKGVGKLGATWKRDQAYVPPHSAGGRTQTYTLHIYALSVDPQFDSSSDAVTREALLAKIKDDILDSAELNVTYTRPSDDADGGSRGPGGDRGPGGQRGPK